MGSDGNTPLHMTATMGSVGVVRIFLSDFGGFNDQIPSIIVVI